jgi:hypothetical protein
VIDYATIYADLYERVASSDDGAAVRALLGGERSIIGGRLAFENTTNRVLPWLVWVVGDTPGNSGDMRTINAAWWAYIAPNAAESRLLEIAARLETLYGYTNALAIDGGRIGVTYRGRPFNDASKGNVLGMEIRIGFLQRG